MNFLPASVEENTLRTPLGDLPLGAYHASTADAINNSMRMLKEGGAQSVKLEGGQIAFNGPSGLTAGSVGGLTGFSGVNTYSGLSFNNFKTTQNVSQFGTFAFDYANIQGAPGGVVSVDKLTFTLTAPGLLASQFTNVVVHFCTASGTKKAKSIAES